MGTDKAGVVFGGQPLWRRQLALLRGINPDQLLVSCRRDSIYFSSEQNIELVHDGVPDAGPLGGIEAILEKARFEFVLILAIDLPQVTTEFLSGLIDASNHAGKGIVPRDERWFQPLAAIYPRASLPLVATHLLQADRSMQSFVRAALQRGLVAEYRVGEAQKRYFKNLNTIADLS